jgi:hypothetical protein
MTKDNPYNCLPQAISCLQHYTRLIAITLSLYEDLQIDNDVDQKMRELPWESSIYENKPPFQKYDYLTIPNWLTCKNYSKIFIKKIDKYSSKIQIRKYAPLVFHHLRKIDDISINDMIKSLDPDSNLRVMNQSFAEGGRSNSPILFTYDKAFLVKLIPSEEKENLLKMLPEYHRRITEGKSLLCHLYGLYRVILDRQESYVIVMKNMNSLPVVVLININQFIIDKTTFL